MKVGKTRERSVRKMKWIAAATIALFLIVPSFSYAGYCNPFTPGEFSLPNCLLNALGHLLEYSVIPILAFIPLVLGNVFDAVVAASLGVGGAHSLFQQIFRNEAVENGWMIIRDMVNMFFIFIIIWIAIATILSISRYHAKQMLARLIIAALLINFSLFFTRVMIDAGNVLAHGVYQSLTGGQNNISITQNFMDLLGLQTLYSMARGIADPASMANNNQSLPHELMSGTPYFINAVMRIATILILSYAFLIMCILFLARTVALVFLMIFSPIGFIGEVVPFISSWSKKWWDTLIGQILVLPVFLLLLYVIFLFAEQIANLRGGGGIHQAMASAGNNAQSINLLINYAIIIFLLLAAIKVAKSLSGEIGKTAVKWASTAGFVAGGAVVAAGAGGAALAGRAAVGRLGQRVASSGALKDLAATEGSGLGASLKRGIGKAGVALSEKAATSSFDIRNSQLFQAGAKKLGMTGAGIGAAGGALNLAKTKVGEGGFRAAYGRKEEKYRGKAEKLAASPEEIRQKTERLTELQNKRAELEKSAEKAIDARGAPRVDEVAKKRATEAAQRARDDIAAAEALRKEQDEVEKTDPLRANRNRAEADRMKEEAASRLKAANQELAGYEAQEKQRNELLRQEMERLAGGAEELKDLENKIARARQEVAFIMPDERGVSERQKAYARELSKPGFLGSQILVGAERTIAKASDGLAATIKEAMAAGGDSAAKAMAAAMGISEEGLRKELGQALEELNKVRPGGAVTDSERNLAFEALANRLEKLSPAFQAAGGDKAEAVKSNIQEIKLNLTAMKEGGSPENIVRTLSWTPEWRRNAAEKIERGEKLKKKGRGKDDHKKIFEDLRELLGLEEEEGKQEKK
jgi:hypothetical protein